MGGAESAICTGTDTIRGSLGTGICQGQTLFRPLVRLVSVPKLSPPTDPVPVPTLVSVPKLSRSTPTPTDPVLPLH